jgi:hypothetical protein
MIMTKGPMLDLRMTKLMIQNVGSAPVRTLAEAQRAHIMAMQETRIDHSNGAEREFARVP